MSLLPTIRVIVHTLRHALAERWGRTWRTATLRRRRIRIGVDIRPFYEPLTGIGWYLYHLLHELAKYDEVELWLFGDARVTDEGPRLHAELPANARLCTFDLRGLPQSRLSRPLTAAAYVVWMKLVDPDVFFAANYFLPRLHASVARRRVIVVHDLTYKRFPELLQKETLENLERTMQREIALADAIVCVSETTRRDLLQFYEVDRRRAIAILSGLGTLPAPQPIDGLPERYILFVSTIEPRKNLPALLDAYERLRARGAYDGSLVVVGRIGWKSESLIPRLRRSGIVHLDYVDARQLATVYERAEVFVFPSLYEGFGFPLLEAMAHGVPTVAARSSSLPEVGGDAALYFDPAKPAQLESQLERLLHDPALREELVERGRQQVRGFRWDIAAKKTLDVLKRAAS
ncbi:MAG TPA: glycosyltransferase family 1 protein [Thermoanaerobaculia bacterium]|nr:glycosyltransferase family 1 protein [Thermoanaerobaculia bacterium]